MASRRAPRRKPESGSIHIETTAGSIQHRHTLWLPFPGVLAFRETVRIPTALNDLPRLGVVCELAEGYENLEYFARGPMKTTGTGNGAPGWDGTGPRSRISMSRISCPRSTGTGRI